MHCRDPATRSSDHSVIPRVFVVKRTQSRWRRQLPWGMGSCRSKVRTLFYLPCVCVGRAVAMLRHDVLNNKLTRSCQLPTTRTRTKVTKAGRWRRSTNLRRSKVPLSCLFRFSRAPQALLSFPPNAMSAALIWKSDTALGFNTMT